MATHTAKSINKLLYQNADRLFRAEVIATEPGIVAGLSQLSNSVPSEAASWKTAVTNGEQVAAGDTLIELSGTAAQIGLAEDYIIGPIGFASGIATRASEFKQGCPESLSLACGGWKKLPSALKPLLREGLAAAGVLPRLVSGDFVYLSKNAVTMLGGVAPAISAGQSIQHGPVAIQVKNVEEALFAAENGAGIIMVDTGRLEDLAEVHAALSAHQFREKLTLAFGGGVKLEDLSAVREAGAQAVDVGRAILDAPLLDLRLTITAR